MCGGGKDGDADKYSKEMRQKPDWLVIELNLMRDLLQSLAAKIYSIPELHAKFLHAKLDFSAFGLGVSIEMTSSLFSVYRD